MNKELDALSNGTRCADCDLRTIPYSRWAALTRAERAEARKAGYQRHGGRGLCNTCYERHRLAGTTIDYERVTVPREVVEDEWRALADAHRSRAENARLIAPRIGMTVAALEYAAYVYGLGGAA